MKAAAQWQFGDASLKGKTVAIQGLGSVGYHLARYVKDEGAATALVKIEQAGTDMGVRGTPTIFINGKQVQAYDWQTLEPFLKGSGA